MIMPCYQELDCTYDGGFGFLDLVSVVGYGEGLFYAYSNNANHSLVWFFGRDRLLPVSTFTIRGLELHSAPPGMEEVVKKLKNKKDVNNPWAVAWGIKNKEKNALGSGTRKPPIGREPRFDPEKVHSPKSSVKKVAEREQIRSRGGRKVSGVSPRRMPKLDVAEVSRVSKN